MYVKLLAEKLNLHLQIRVLPVFQVGDVITRVGSDNNHSSNDDRFHESAFATTNLHPTPAGPPLDYRSWTLLPPTSGQLPLLAPGEIGRLLHDHRPPASTPRTYASTVRHARSTPTSRNDARLPLTEPWRSG